MIKNKKENTIKKSVQMFILKLKRNKAVSASIFSSIACLILLTYIGFKEYGGFLKFSIDEFEIGMVSDRDVVANRDMEYIDEKATEVRRSAKSHSVYAVFNRDNRISAETAKIYLEFSSDLTELKKVSKKFDDFRFAMLEKYPAVISEAELEKIYLAEDSNQIISISLGLMKQMFDVGIIEFPVGGINKFNNNEITIAALHGNKWVYENVPLDSLIFSDGTKIYIKTFLRSIQKSNYFGLINALIFPFLKPNILYNSEATDRRVDEALRQVPPVMRSIHKNQKLIKRGFIITEESYNQLKAYQGAGKYMDRRLFWGSVLYIFACFAVGLFLFSDKIYSDKLAVSYKILILLSFNIIYVQVLFLSKLSFFSNLLDLAPLIPASLFTMLIAVLASERAAVFTSFLLGLAVLGASNFNIPISMFTLFSGIAGSAFIKITGKRMDLIKTACILAVIHPFIAASLIIIFAGATEGKIILLFACSLGGFLNGILMLGFLPIFETLLNSPTSFRLMELSDLNSPIMQKMLVTVAGTYSHSVLVANLAETACRNIGANPLLARVGAYYHDIGKIEQGEYFIENQKTYNKHMDLNPRLSATVIRSHVKIGVEKAKQMRLPQEVIDIISQHHGNSLISFFYNKAKEENPDTDPEDFSYPGEPPYSKEAAVVMLADVVEAACRSLQKPSVPRLSKFISELFVAKIEHGQLDNSALTFREINIIKETFIDILAAYYHSRVEYPNQKDPDGNGSAGEDIMKENSDEKKNKTKEKTSKPKTGRKTAPKSNSVKGKN